MQQRSLSELQGVSTQRGASTRRTARKQASTLGSTPRASPPRWSSGLRRGSGCRLCPPRGALLWAWLLLAALVVPGAWSFLNEEQEELIVELHNHYRGQVSPSASAMLPLKWDASLKVIAEGYAAKCIWNHNPDLEETGENLFAGTGPLDLRMALEKWFLEHLDYEYHNNSCPEDKMCGHYTQMVWADTHRVGCAFHVCNTMEGLDFERASFLVCNYYPAGNYEGEKPYEEGDWCSRCPDNLQKCENNLCVADTVEEEDEEDDDEEGEEGTVVPPPETADPFLDPTTTTTTTSSSQDSDDTPHPATPASGTQPPDVPEPTQGEEEVQEEEEEKKIEGKEEQEKEKKKEEEEEQEKEKKGEEQEKKKEEKEEEKEKKKEEKKEAEQEKEKKKEEEQEQEKKKEEKKEEEQEKGKENIDDKKEREREREIERERERDRISMASAVCSVLSPSLLLACLTGILILRL